MPATISLCTDIFSVCTVHPLESLTLSPLARGDHATLFYYEIVVPFGELIKNYPADLRT